MRTTQLGSSGELVSALALGAMGMGTRADEATSFATLDAYAQDGGGFIDTADAYSWSTHRAPTAVRVRSCSAAGCAGSAVATTSSSRRRAPGW